MRRLVLIAVLGALVAGCGGGTETTARPETVEGGTTPTTETTDTTETGTTETTGGEAQGDAEAGKAIYAEGGCGSCHTFAPAGSSGTTGPDLDELPQLAEKAGQPLDEFTRESVTDPGAYVEEGFPNIMPAYEGEDQQVDDLVAFLTQT